ncbi:MAG: hypothetical protein HY981_01930 [Candidatus Magasanikbacteria bacterium]|nr:hypothetical protein [Candidatus Magasanikbacteria bacterium]
MIRKYTIAKKSSVQTKIADLKALIVQEKKWRELLLSELQMVENKIKELIEKSAKDKINALRKQILNL